MNWRTIIIIILIWIIISILFHKKVGYILDRYVWYKTIQIPPQPNVRNLLLVSNSKEYELGRESFFNHCKSNIQKFLKPFDIKKVVFIPYAGANITPLGVPLDYDEYTQIVADEFFTDMNIKLIPIHQIPNSYDKKTAILNAECIFIAGGNAFKLMHELEKNDLVGAIRKVVDKGIPYLGVSSGTVIASPSLHTSRSIPIMSLQSYQSLDLVPFYINVHYYRDLGSRLNQYLLRDPQRKILAVTEGCVIHIVGNDGELVGFGEGEIIERENEIFTREDISCGSKISFLLKN